MLSKMKLNRIKVKDFMSYEDEELNFNDLPQHFLLCGANGAGKSTIIVDAITTALWGRARATKANGQGIEQLIKVGKERFTVEIEFEMNGSIYIVRRAKGTSGGTELTFIENGIDRTEKIKETQEKIQNVIKFDYDAFMSAACVGQGASNFFMTKGPDERKDIFAQVMNLEVYDVLEKKANEKKKLVKNEITIIESKLERLQTDLGNKALHEQHINEGKSRIVDIEIEIKLKENELEKEFAQKALWESKLTKNNEIMNRKNEVKRQLVSQRQSYDQGETIRKRLQNEIDSRKDESDFITTAVQEIEKLQDEYTVIVSERTRLLSEIEMYKGQVKETKTKYDNLKNYDKGTCELCFQNIHSEHKELTLNKLKEDGKSLLLKIKNLETQFAECNRSYDARNTELAILKQKLNKARISQSELDTSRVKIQGVIEKLALINNNIKNLEAELAELEQQKVEQIEQRMWKDSDLKREIQTLRSQLNDWTSKVTIAETEIKRIDKNRKEIEVVENQLKDLNEQAAIYDDLEKAFGKDGIQAQIIKNALPDVQEEINKFLHRMTNDRVTLEFVPEKDGKGKKKGSTIETLEIIIHDELGSRPYELFSGGEKFRIDFASHIGLARYLSKRAGASVDFFIIDEGVGALDDTGKDEFLEIIDILKEYFHTIVVISHIDEIKEAFDGKVEVYKTPTGSKIKVISK